MRPATQSPPGASLKATAVALLGLVVGSCAGLPSLETAHHPTKPLAVDEARASSVISSYRKAHGQSAVSLDPALVKVALRQAEAMASADDLSHVVDGALPQRLAAGGADRSAAVENVSAGYDSLDSAVASWRQSPAHNANLLFAPMRRMGIAAARAPSTRFKTFWALVMTN